MRKFHTLIFAAAVGGTLTVAAQHNTAGGYQELNDGAMPDAAAWNAVPEGLQLSWASKDVHYRRREVPALKLKTDTVVYAWRGERASMQAVLFSRGVVDDSLSVSLSAWRRADGSGDAVPAAQGRARFVNYVMSDDYQGCGYHPDGLPAYLVPDVIDLDLPRRVLPREVRPVWVTLEVPRDAEPGEYVADLDVTGRQSGERLGRLALRIRVVDRTLPEPGRQQFSIDFWQQPYATARYYGLEKWSPAHLDALRPYLELLARAGQRVVSAILFYEPWGEQSNDKFDAMVRTTKRADGTWAYDYSVFDRWVELCAECGILLDGAVGHDVPLLRRGAGARRRPQNDDRQPRVQGPVDALSPSLRRAPEGEGLVRQDVHRHGRARPQPDARRLRRGAGRRAGLPDVAGWQLPSRARRQGLRLLPAIRPAVLGRRAGAPPQAGLHLHALRLLQQSALAQHFHEQPPLGRRLPAAPRQGQRLRRLPPLVVYELER